MRAERKDANHGVIVDGLRAFGASVDVLPGGNGRPDLLVGYKKVNFLFELKDWDGKLNALQKVWHAGWRGRVHVGRTLDECIAVLRYWTR